MTLVKQYFAYMSEGGAKPLGRCVDLSQYLMISRHNHLPINGSMRRNKLATIASIWLLMS